MSISRIIILIVGAVLAIGGLFFLFNNLHDWLYALIDLALIIVGVAILSGKVITL